ncbi:MAG: flagellar basal body rod protein FlgF [Porphyrobacter sp.]|nr:flagellar basal body rod protein FlgF [Porphyrobacter sp.]
MDRLIHTALSGMRASMDRQRVIASNMANTGTLGFRAELLDQRPVTLKTAGAGLEVRAMQRAAVRGADMAAGEMVETGQPLDIAIEGDALLAVQAADGTEAYTRRGDLSLSPTGLLVTGEGHPVMGQGGPITLPLGATPAISPDGTVTVSDPAVPEAPAQEVGRIKLASADGSPIAKGLDGLFRVEGGGILPADEAATLATGALEQSNVNPAEVLVEMIDAQRLFAMRSKLISTAGDLDASGAQLMRLG